MIMCLCVLNCYFKFLSLLNLSKSVHRFTSFYVGPKIAYSREYLIRSKGEVMKELFLWFLIKISEIYCTFVELYMYLRKFY